MDASLPAEVWSKIGRKTCKHVHMYSIDDPDPAGTDWVGCTDRTATLLHCKSL